MPTDGTPFNDTMTGAAGNDTLNGLGGNDRLIGAGGNDSLFGGEGADLLYGGTGNDGLYGGDGNDSLFGSDGVDESDTLDGGDGTDTAYVYRYNSADAQVLDLSSGNATLTAGGHTTVLTSIERLYFLGSNTAGDSITGTAGNDSLYGYGGNDSLFGGLGNDYLEGGTGNDGLYGGAGDDFLLSDDNVDASDTLDGGDGTDTAYVYRNSSANAQVLDLSSGNATLTAGGHSTVLTSIERLHFRGSNTAADSITGTAGNDTLYGYGGNDSLTGGEGADLLVGGTGNDGLYGGDGNDSLYSNDGVDASDTLDGGDGTDTAYVNRYNSANAQVLDLSSGNATLTAGGHSTVLTSFEQLYFEGSNTAGDSITGTAGNDTLYGFGGNDSLTGGLGNDYLYGGDGDDSLFAGIGSDTVSGGAGTDTVTMAKWAGAYTTSTSGGYTLLTDTATGQTTWISSDVENIVYAAPPPPAAPVISFPTDTGANGTVNAAELGMGPLSIRVTLDGATVGDTVVVTINGAEQTVTVAALDVTNGYVTVTLATPPEGETTVSAVHTRNGAPSNAGTGSVMVDTVAPAAPVVTIEEDANNDGYINAAELSGTVQVRVTLTGTGAVAGDIITLTGGGTHEILAGDLTLGYVDLSVDAAAEGATLTVSATITDAAGNTSAAGSDSAVLDTVAPSAPVISGFDDDVAPGVDTQTGGATNDTTPTLSGTADVGSTVQIYAGMTLLGSVVATDGIWSFTPATLAEGSYNFTATATDAAGNTSAPSAALTLTVDTTAPAAPGVTVTENSNTDGYLNAAESTGPVGIRISLTGTNAVEGDTITLTDTLSTVTHTLTAGDITAGLVDLEITAPGTQGAVTYSATLTDAAQNTSPAGEITIMADTLAPTVSNALFSIPAITEANVGGTLTLTITFNEAMNETVDPLVTLTPLPAGLTLASAAWVGGNYVVTWTIADANIDLTTVALDVTGAQDLAGNPMDAFANATAFTFNTLDPVVTAANLAGTVTELPDGAIGETTATLTATGDISFTDNELGDVHSVGVTPGGAGYVGTFLAGLSNPATGDGVGVVTWTYSINDGAVDYLAAGQNITQTYNVTVDDGTGGSFTRTVSITIEGTNDLPVISGYTAPAAIGEDAALTANGTLTVADVDVSDAVTAAVSGNAVVGGTGGAGALTTADLNNMFTLTNTAVIASGATTGSVGWAFNATAGAFDHLAAGEELTLAYTIRVTDSAGAEVDQVVTITITGANDGPVAIAATASTTEDAAAISGTLTSTDPDNGATAAYTLASGQAAVAGFTLNTDGTWTFDPTNAAYQYLALNQELEITINYTVTDDKGASSNSTLTITLTGTNDTPQAISATATATEDGAVVTGQLTSTDADITGTTATYTLASGQAAVAGFTLNADGSWSFDPSDAAYQYLAHGQQLPITINYTVTDDKGASTNSTLTITLTGANDAPTLGFDQRFSTGTDGIGTGGTFGAITTAASGTNGIFTPDGGAYAIVTEVGSGPFTRFDGYRSEFINGLTAEIDVWLDISWTAGSGFEYSVAASRQNGNHLRDFIFHVTKDTSTGKLLVAGSNNASGAPREDLETLNHTEVTTTGWYKLQHVFRDVGGVLSVDLNLLDAAGNILWTETRSNAGDLIASIVGGSRYGWFTDITVPGGLAVDNWRLGQFSGRVAELVDNDPNEGTATLTASGLIPFRDTDLADNAHTVEAMADGTGYLGTFTPIITPAGGTDGQGHVSWTFSVSDADVNYLSAGETLTQTYTVTLSDGKGGTATQTVTITLTGANDAPVAIAATASADEDGAVVTGQLTSTDADITDTTATYSLASGQAVVDGFTLNPNGSWSFDPSNAAYQYLALDQELVITVNYTVTDDKGASSDSALTITLTGANDAPTITSGAAAATGTVFAAGDLYGFNQADSNPALSNQFEPLLNLDAAISTALTTHGVSGIANVLADTLVALKATVPDATAADAIAQVWDYLDDGYVLNAFDTNINHSFAWLGLEYAKYLSAGGRPLTDVVAKYVPDIDMDTNPDRLQSLHDNLLGNLNNSALQQVGRFGIAPNSAYDAFVAAMTAAGVADLLNRPIYSGNQGTVNTSTAWDLANGYLPLASGQLTAFDVDATDVLTWTVGTIVGTYGTFAVNATTGEWTYTFSGAAALAEGATHDEVFLVTVSDGKGGTATQTVTVTITGTNDAPVLTGTAATLADATEGTAFEVSIADLLAGWTDVDTDDVLSVTGLTVANATAVLNGAGTAYVITTTDPDFNGTLTLTYFVTDGSAIVPASLEVEVLAVADGDTVVTKANLNTAVLTGGGDLFVGGGIPGDDLSWVVATDSADAAGVEIGLNVGLRFSGGYQVDPQDATGRTYVAPVGAAAGTPQDGPGADDNAWARWNFQVSIGADTDGNGGALSDRNYTFTISALDASGTPTTTILTYTMEDVAAAAAFQQTGHSSGPVFNAAVAAFLALPLYQGSINFKWLLDNARALDPSVPAFDPALPGYYRVQVQATNKVNDSVELTNYINIRLNSAPEANNDTGTTLIEAGAAAGVATANGDVLANDTDPDTLPVADTGELVVTNIAFGMTSVAVTTGTTINGTYGTLTINADGTWSYALENSWAATQALTNGNDGTEVFTYTVADPDGVTDTATLTLTITGANDAPTITATTIAGVTEDAAVDMAGDLTASGTITVADVDAGDVLTVTSTLATSGWSAGTLSPAQITALTAGFGATNTGWTYAVPNSAVQFLGNGESVTLTFTVTVNDGSGADNNTASETVVITINGANDAPVLTAASHTITDTVAANDFDNIEGQMVATDDDQNADLTFTASGATVSLTGGAPAVSYGTLTMNTNGSYTFARSMRRSMRWGPGNR
jgi:VCBS repeat-containing protein